MTEIDYRPYPADISRHQPDSGHWYNNDPAIAAGRLEDIPQLASSPDWRDRIRAEVLRRNLSVSLPDQFPALYERPDSPHQHGLARPRAFAWVVSPDTDMLEALLPWYQELWDSYTSQWGPSSRRIFRIGHLDNLNPSGVYLPGTTAEQVIAHTLNTHPGMLARAPGWARGLLTSKGIT